ncbi:hypothetical protein B0H13DRAFT_1917600 [Mycena leptocephala]|nr:hypothetical protein B0H13DRAFT_1917600 [Mycena leptocephala]
MSLVLSFSDSNILSFSAFALHFSNSLPPPPTDAAERLLMEPSPDVQNADWNATGASNFHGGSEDMAFYNLLTESDINFGQVFARRIRYRSGQVFARCIPFMLASNWHPSGRHPELLGAPPIHVEGTSLNLGLWSCPCSICV